ncbi:MAG: hypothetical protein KKH25_05990 [Candidatus Omnitrophica bacterium]|nr:hypothetical protein [Candidatus Omnitrophota bacterium]
MLRCKICKVPLNGFLGKIAKAIFKAGPSGVDSEVCNKCQDNQQPAAKKSKAGGSGETYQCQICQRMIHQEHSLEHIKAEEYIIELIKKDHKQWQHKGPTCRECIEYYRRLVNETEI